MVSLGVRESQLQKKEKEVNEKMILLQKRESQKGENIDSKADELKKR